MELITNFTFGSLNRDAGVTAEMLDDNFSKIESYFRALKEENTRLNEENKDLKVSLDEIKKRI